MGQRSRQLMDTGDELWATIDDILRQPLDAPAIHDLRIALKRLRAAWLLRWYCHGRERCREEERHLRTVARSLAGQRDADVVIETRDRLLEDCTPGEREALLAVVWPEDRFDDGESTALDLGLALEQACRRWHQDLEACRDAQLTAGLQRCLDKMRAWWQRAREADQAAAVHHRWRRWVKHVTYGAQALGLLGEHLQSLQRLGSALGKRHDLVVFREALPEDLPSTQRDLIAGRVARQDRDLAEQCRRLGKICAALRVQ